MIRQPLGEYNDIQSSQVFEPYKFNTKPSLPYIKPKRALNIPEVYYDENPISERIVEQIATDNFSNQIKESFENIGYIPKVKSNTGNISFVGRQIRKLAFDQSTQTTSTGTSTEMLSPSVISARQPKAITPSKFLTPMKKSPTYSDYPNSPELGRSLEDEIDFLYREGRKQMKSIKELKINTATSPKVSVKNSPKSSSDYGSDIFNAIMTDKKGKAPKSESDYGSDIYNAIITDKKRKKGKLL